MARLEKTVRLGCSVHPDVLSGGGSWSRGLVNALMVLYNIDQRPAAEFSFLHNVHYGVSWKCFT